MVARQRPANDLALVLRTYSRGNKTTRIFLTMTEPQFGFDPGILNLRLNQITQYFLFSLFSPHLPLFYWAIKQNNVIARHCELHHSEKLLAQAAETGQPSSLAGHFWRQRLAADTMAGLTVLEYLADRGDRRDATH
jgi:hypothetical protein